MRRRGTLIKYEAPNYAGMANVVFHHRAEGLVTGTTNSYGVVDGSNNVTKIISILTTTHEFDSNGTAPVLSGSGVDKIITFGGAGRFRHNGLSSVFNNFHFRGVITDLKWQVHGVVKFGTGSNPNALYGWFGNNGTASASKGACGFYSDSAAAFANNNMVITITRGTSNSFILFSSNSNIVPPNQWLDLFIRVDKTLPQESQTFLSINGHEYTVIDRIDSATMVTTPTYAMEIGGCGNATVPLVGAIKEITFQDGVNTDAWIKSFIKARMTKYRITPNSYAIDNIIQKPKLRLLSSLDESRYYLSSYWMQSPLNSNNMINVFSDTLGHVDVSFRTISYRRSTDRGKTIGAKQLLWDPSDAQQPGDLCAGYGNNGRLHVIADTQEGIGPGLPHKIQYFYSDNDGVNWTGPIDITYAVPSDGLLTWRVYCRLIDNAGRLMMVYYKMAEEGDFTSTARYLLYSDDNGANWASILIQTQGSGQFRNESAIEALSSTVLLVVSRDEGTNEFYQSMSTDNGATWSNQGALSLGETLTQAGPPRLVKFQIGGTNVIAIYYADRAGDILKGVYGTAANLIASGLTGWNLQTKYNIYQGSVNEHLHYGDVCHYNNDFHAQAIYARDAFPSSGAGTQNILCQYEVETVHYQYIKALLGL
jgi:hypothetical protein